MRGGHLATAARDDRARASGGPGYQAYRAEVVRLVRLSPHFVRITFAGPELEGFGHAGYDQRIKVALPRPGHTVADLPSGPGCYRVWRTLPESRRPTVRTYTVRAYRAHARELDIDFVLHGSHGAAGGPMSRWATSARVGDEVALLGPDRPGQGRLWGVEWAPPPGISRVIVAGDETALPAIGAIATALPPGMRAVVCAEVPDHTDIPTWEVPEAVDLRWLARNRDGHGSDRGASLVAAVRDALRTVHHPVSRQVEPVEPASRDGMMLWEVPEQATAASGHPYLWMAGEATVMRVLRRIARVEFGLPRTALACMGYWRHGTAEAA
jgi:NADPH-dependent ferric siderophore reductase